jgi:hypothetical protein
MSRDGSPIARQLSADSVSSINSISSACSCTSHSHTSSPSGQVQMTPLGTPTHGPSSHCIPPDSPNSKKKHSKNKGWVSRTERRELSLYTWNYTVIISNPFFLCFSWEVHSQKPFLDRKARLVMGLHLMQISVTRTVFVDLVISVMETMVVVIIIAWTHITIPSQHHIPICTIMVIIYHRPRIRPTAWRIVNLQGLRC